MFGKNHTKESIEKMKESADFTGHALELVQKVNEVIEELNELKKAKTD